LDLVPRSLVFNGEVDDVTRRRKSLFSKTLVLPGFDGLEAAKIDDPKKLDSVKQTLVLRGRHLESALFDGADLRKADLDGAQLQGAALSDAQLQGAALDKAQLQGALLDYARLQGALLTDAKIQGTSLIGAKLQGASLAVAQLQGASFYLAELQGARLDYAQLQGAELSGVQLQGTSLEGAKLAGADLDNAFVWRARFSFSLKLIEAFSHQRIVWDSKYIDAAMFDPKPWTKESYLALKEVIEEKVPTGQPFRSGEPRANRLCSSE
jgi:Pentapeptide repeats (8 copies)